MNALELAHLFIERIGDWKLEWEVLYTMFQVLIDDFVATEEQLERAIRIGLSEWDV